MKEAEIRPMFDNGLLSGTTICPHPMEVSWMIRFDPKREVQVYMDSQRTSPRRSKTLDAAFHSAHYIGFQKVMVVKSYG